MARILCVEDNPQNMRLVRKILNHQGYDVLEAEDGTTGIKLAKDEEPDLILMDINLPDIDGLEATGIIKADEELSSIPIVALTANAMYGDEERCLAAGCDGYISKPVSKSKLLTVIADFLAQREADANDETTASDENADSVSDSSDAANENADSVSDSSDAADENADNNVSSVNGRHEASDSTDTPEVSRVPSPSGHDDS